VLSVGWSLPNVRLESYSLRLPIPNPIRFDSRSPKKHSPPLFLGWGGVFLPCCNFIPAYGYCNSITVPIAKPDYARAAGR